MLKVYLAGPITGQCVEDAKSWRDDAQTYLREHGFDAYSPLRGKDYIEPGIPLPAFYKREPDQSSIGGILSCARGILTRDHWDVRRCDILLAYFLDADRVSIGTVMEVAMAHVYGKIIVGCIDDLHDHPFITECVTHPCPDLPTALEIIKRLA